MWVSYDYRVNMREERYNIRVGFWELGGSHMDRFKSLRPLPSESFWMVPGTVSVED